MLDWVAHSIIISSLVCISEEGIIISEYTVPWGLIRLQITALTPQLSRLSMDSNTNLKRLAADTLTTCPSLIWIGKTLVWPPLCDANYRSLRFTREFPNFLMEYSTEYRSNHSGTYPVKQVMSIHRRSGSHAF